MIETDLNLCSFIKKNNIVKVNTNATHGIGYNVDDKSNSNIQYLTNTTNKCKGTGDRVFIFPKECNRSSMCVYIVFFFLGSSQPLNL